MKRILLVLTVALVVAAMMVVMAMPAFAAPPKGCHPGSDGGFKASHHKCFHPGP